MKARQLLLNSVILPKDGTDPLVVRNLKRNYSKGTVEVWFFGKRDSVTYDLNEEV